MNNKIREDLHPEPHRPDRLRRSPQPLEDQVSEFPRRLQPVTHDEARAILSRFNASHWGNIGQEKARYSIPCDPTRDDDCLMDQYIREQRARDAELAQLREAVRVLAISLARYRSGKDNECSVERLQADCDVDANPTAKAAIDATRKEPQ